MTMLIIISLQTQSFSNIIGSIIVVLAADKSDKVQEIRLEKHRLKIIITFMRT